MDALSKRRMVFLAEKSIIKLGKYFRVGYGQPNGLRRSQLLRKAITHQL